MGLPMGDLQLLKPPFTSTHTACPPSVQKNQEEQQRLHQALKLEMAAQVRGAGGQEGK